MKKRRKMTKHEKYNTVMGYLFISPSIIGLIWLTLIPFVQGLYLSFTDYNVLSEPTWVGIANYVKMFTKDEIFWTSFKVTCKFSLVQVPLKLVVSLLVALALAKKSKMTGAYRIMFYIPSLLGGSVAVAMTWKMLWGGKGVINQILDVLHLPAVNWLNDTRTALYVLILLGVWQFGSQMLIFLAAIKNVPHSLHESAIIDGGGPVKRFFKITLPMITPSLFYNLVNGIIGSMQAFASSYLITEGQPKNTTLYYSLYQYQQGFQYMKMGYASALAWFMMLVIVALTAIVFKTQKSWVYYEESGK